MIRTAVLLFKCYPFLPLPQLSVPAGSWHKRGIACPLQFGPNCTTFLLAGELYPTDVRTTAHGISAGVAKLGALWVSLHMLEITTPLLRAAEQLHSASQLVLCARRSSPACDAAVFRMQASVWFNYLGSRKRFWYCASLNSVVGGHSRAMCWCWCRY
jgi:hypothetical protein